MKTAFYLFLFALLLGLVSFLSFQHIGSQKLQALGNEHPYFQQKLALLSDTLLADAANAKRQVPNNFARSLVAADGIRLRHQAKTTKIQAAGPANALSQIGYLQQKGNNNSLRFAFDRPIQLSDYVEVEMNLNAYPDYLRTLDFTHTSGRSLLPELICDSPIELDYVLLRGTISANSILKVNTPFLSLSELDHNGPDNGLAIRGTAASLGLSFNSLKRFDLRQLSSNEISLQASFPNGNTARLKALEISINYQIDSDLLTQATPLPFAPDTLYHPAAASIKVLVKNDNVGPEMVGKLVVLVGE